MIKFTITERLEIEISGVDNMGDQMKVKRLPNRRYDQARDLWVVPVRPGLAASIREVFGFETSEDIWKAGEEYFLELIAPPVNVDPFKIGAGVAVELSVMYHFYTFHNGDRVDYARVHYPYIMGE